MCYTSWAERTSPFRSLELPSECPFLPSLPGRVPTRTFSLPPCLRFLRQVRSYQAVPTFFLFYPLFPFFFCPSCGPGFLFFFFLKKRKRKITGRLCIVVFGLLLCASSSSSPSCLIGIISRLLRSFPRGPLPLPSPPKPILSRGVAPPPEIDSDRAILSWANGKSRPKIKRSSRLLLGFAWVGKTGAGQPSGPRSSRRARDLILCPCTSDVRLERKKN